MHFGMKTYLLGCLLLIGTVAALAQSSPGDIAIIGFNSDGDDDLSFVTFVDIPNGNSIFFTDNLWDGSMLATTEGTIIWTNNTGTTIPGGTAIALGDLATGSPTASSGIAASSGSFNLANSNEGVLAYTGTLGSPTAFLYAIATGTGGFGSIAGTGLTAGFTAIQLSNDIDITQYIGPKTDYTQTDFLNAISNVSCFWVEQNGSGDQSNDGTDPDAPLDETTFTIAATSSVSNLVISEIMYNTPGNDDEWIEICETSGIATNITSFTLTYNGNSFSFPSVTVGANSCIVVIVGDDGDSDGFNEDCPITVPAADVVVVTGVTVGGSTSTNALPNSPAFPGEPIALLDNSGNTVDIVFYDDADGADGNGKSLYLPTLTSNNYATCTNWIESIDDGGSPNATGGTCASVCEILTAGLAVSCNNNSTPLTLIDDTYTFNLTVTGNNVAATYTVSGNSGVPGSSSISGSGSYNVASSTFGPYAISGGNKFISIQDASSPTCSLDLVVPAPAAGCGSVSSVNIVTSSGAAGPSVGAQNAAATLDDTFRAYEEQFCPGTYTPNSTVWVDACNTGPSSTVGGLIISTTNSTGQVYNTATLTEKLVAIDNSNITSLGNNRTGGCGSFGVSSSSGTLQGDSPKPNEGALGTSYYNAASSLSSTSAFGNSLKSGLAINFNPSVTRLGLFLGDVESRSDLQEGYPAVIAFFNGGTLLALEPIPTGTINQANCDGDAVTDFDGCGNNETVFIQYINETTPVTDIIVTTGQVTYDPSNIRNNTNSIAFFGLTVGGTCSANFLPVELTRFEVVATTTTNELYWQTASEQNNDYFEIERSADGFRFESIGQVDGAGDAYTFNEYAFSDAKPLPGTNYYRLRQVDYDGSYHLSQVRTVFRPYPGMQARLQPTLAQEEVTLLFGEALEQNLEVTVFNTLGQKVRTLQMQPGLDQLTMKVNDLPEGHYFVHYGSTEILRFIKQ